ncbi:MAG: hypothetical protein EA401_08800 [Planctomycetota bacterium]|nr:MAG: hypothetical protein EA401_08800 [Planctomycetota bacterium]
MATRIHFSGVAGAGMNPLARLLAHRGMAVSGSDRALDQGQCGEVATLLRDAGVVLFPQDGSAIGEDVQRLVHSTAVERDTPEMAAAQERNVLCQSRPALLAELIAQAQPGVAVAGTSGKSTIVGMVAWIAEVLAAPLTVLGGASLAKQGASHMGCFAAAGVDAPLLAEACESDGTLVGYHPGIGLIHNISRDHNEITELQQQFHTFAGHCDHVLYCSDDVTATSCAAAAAQRTSYGEGDAADWRLQVIRTGPWRAQGDVHGPNGEQVFLDLPQPGHYTLLNATAAILIAAQLGYDVVAAARAMYDFPGVARRYQVIGTTDHGIRVIDDYAHNGAKIAAVLAAAQEGSDRVLAIFQPHGYGPARFLREELRECMPQWLRPGDRLCYSEIFYAGGSVQADISSADLAADLIGYCPAAYAPNHMAVVQWACEQAMPGDTILVMGARDPQLPGLARCIFDML